MNYIETQSKKNRVQLRLKTRKFHYVPESPEDGNENGEEEDRTMAEFIFKTDHRTQTAIRSVFGRMHFREYDDIIYPFDTAKLRLWKALSWNRIEKKKVEKIATGKFKREPLSKDLLKTLREQSSWSSRDIVGLTNQITSYLGSVSAVKTEAEDEKELSSQDTNEIVNAIEADIVNAIKKHTNRFALQGDEIFDEKITKYEVLEIEFNDFILIVDDPDTSAILLDLKPLCEQIRDRVFSLKRWRADGVPEEERDYKFAWEHPTHKDAGYTPPPRFVGPFDHQWGHVQNSHVTEFECRLVSDGYRENSFMPDDDRQTNPGR